MSEGIGSAVTAGGSAAGSTGGTQTSTSQGTTGAPSNSQGGESAGSFGAQTQNQNQSASETRPGETQAERTERILGEGDMDAIVVMKVNGKEERMTVREAMKRSQLASASHQKMQEAAKMAKQAQQLVHLLQNDPAALFREFGKDPAEFAEMILAQKYEQAQMTPEQKELAELREERKRWQEAQENQKKSVAEQRRAQLAQQTMTSLDTEIGEAFKESGLPKDKFLVSQIAAELLAASKQKIPLTAREAAAKVKARWESSNRAVFEGMDAQAIQNLLGPKALKILSDFELKKVTEQSASQFGQQGQSTYQSGGAPAKSNVVNEAGWREWVKR